MRRWYGSVLLIIVLSSSCNSGVEPTAEPEPITREWTACVNSRGFEELALSGASDLIDGLNVESRTLFYSDKIDLVSYLEITVDEGHIKELRITIEGIKEVPMDSLYTDLHDHMNTLYGEAMPTDAYATWRAATANGMLMELELMDARPMFQREEIIIHWKEHADRLYED